LKSEKLFVDGRSDVRMDVPTDRQTFRPLILLGRISGVDLKTRTYCSVITGGTSYVQKISWSLDMCFLRYTKDRRWQIDRDMLTAILCTLLGQSK